MKRRTKQTTARNEWKKQRADRNGCQKENQNLRNDKQADPILSLPLSAESCWVVVRVGEQWDGQPVRRMEAGARGRSRRLGYCTIWALVHF